MGDGLFSIRDEVKAAVWRDADVDVIKADAVFDRLQIERILFDSFDIDLIRFDRLAVAFAKFCDS